MQLNIRPYESTDERDWLRCRVLAFLDSAYYDDVRTARDQYSGPSLELVAQMQGQLVGLLDIEYEREPGELILGEFGAASPAPGGIIHHLAVHPDFQRKGVGTRLLEAALQRLRAEGVVFLDAWTRDDAAACRWYEAHGFACIDDYLHVCADGSKEAAAAVTSNIPGLTPVRLFAHYSGERPEEIRGQFERVHECRHYRRKVSR